ncbi:MAG: hypothetical protein Q7R45_14385 [Sulfuricaulis sp.]|nr:hypothetical protein [Sulfuricaulis sp.]
MPIDPKQDAEFEALARKLESVRRRPAAKKRRSPLALFDADKYLFEQEVEEDFDDEIFLRDFLSAPAADKPVYLSLPGTAGNYASTPDSAANSVVGDLDLKVRAALDDWTPAATSTLLNKWTTTGNQRAYMLQVLAGGTLRLSWSANGTAVIAKDSTVATGVTDATRKWVRATLDVDNGAVGNDVKFYTSDDGADWTQLGTTVTTAATTAVFDSTAALILGGNDAGATERLTGKVYSAEVRNGIDGSVVAAFNPFRDAPGNVDAFTAYTGGVWTINKSGGTPAALV